MGLARIIGAGSGSIKKLVAEALTRLGVTTAASDKDSVVVANIDELATTKYNSGHDDGEDSVTVSQSVSGRTVTAKASNGKTSSASVALGTDSGSHTFTLAPTGNNTATKDLSAGYYEAGTVTADGSKSYEAGADSVTLSTSVSGNVVTATASNGKTATGTVTSKGSLTTELTPTGNNTATKTFAAGYYDGGTITANGSAAYSAGKAAASNVVYKQLTGYYTAYESHPFTFNVGSSGKHVIIATSTLWENITWIGTAPTLSASGATINSTNNYCIEKDNGAGLWFYIIDMTSTSPSVTLNMLLSNNTSQSAYYSVACIVIG